MKTFAHTSDPNKDFDGASSMRVVSDFVDGRGFSHAWGAMTTAPTNTLAPPSNRDLRRFEAWDHRLQVWVACPGYVTARLRRMPEQELKRFLKTHAAGVRVVAYPGEPGDDDEVALDKALNLGLLTLGGLTYRTSVSPTGNVRLVRAGKEVTYSRDALLDAVHRRSF